MHPVSFRLSPSARVTAMQQISSHGLFDLDIQAEGDTWIDDHHTNEDLGELSMRSQAAKVDVMQRLFPWLAQACSGTPLPALCIAPKLSERCLAPWTVHRQGGAHAR